MINSLVVGVFGYISNYLDVRKRQSVKNVEIAATFDTILVDNCLKLVPLFEGTCLKSFCTTSMN